MIVLESSAGTGRDAELVDERLGNQMLRDQADIECVFVPGNVLFAELH